MYVCMYYVYTQYYMCGVHEVTYMYVYTHVCAPMVVCVCTRYVIYYISNDSLSNSQTLSCGMLSVSFVLTRSYLCAIAEESKFVVGWMRQLGCRKKSTTFGSISGL